MKRKLYSVILLFSMLSGIMQPVIPMIEYHLFENGLPSVLIPQAEEIAVFCNTLAETETTPALCRCEDDMPDSELLNDEFYPVPVKISGSEGSPHLTESNGYYPLYDEKTRIRHSLPSSPPPRS